MEGSEPAPEGEAEGRGAARLPLIAAPLFVIAALGAFLLTLKLVRRRRALDGLRPVTAQSCDSAEPGRGRAAIFPWAIPPLGWKDILWRAWRGWGARRLGSLSGGVTFFLLLGTFPAIAAFVSVYGLFLDPRTLERSLQQLSLVFPQDAVTLIGGQMVRLAGQKHEALSAALGLSALASIWSANAGMKALFDGLNAAYGEVEKRPWLSRTLISYAATLASLMFMVAVTLLTVAAPIFLHTLGFHQLRLWFAPVRWLLLYVMAAFGFALLYRFGPSRAMPRWRWVVWGGAGAALLWMLGSIGFSSFLNTFTHLGATYGSLGAMIGFMLWVWFTVMVVLMGAELSAEIEHQTAHDTTAGPPRPLGERGAVMADTVGEAFTMSPREARDYARDFVRRQAGHVRNVLRMSRR